MDGFDDFEDDDNLETFELGEIAQRAWAAWLVSEDTLLENPSEFGPQSFGLLALGIILEVIKAASDAGRSR